MSLTTIGHKLTDLGSMYILIIKGFGWIVLGPFPYYNQ